MFTAENIWLAVGFGAQILFSSRFLIQWLASERAGRSIIPFSFWFLSLGGGLLLLSYAIWRKDPVFILGQSTGVFIYSRNIYMIIRERKKGKKTDSESASKPD